jgi:hypothetical protein
MTFFHGILGGSFKIETFVVLNFNNVILYFFQAYFGHVTIQFYSFCQNRFNSMLHTFIKGHLTQVFWGFLNWESNF